MTPSNEDIFPILSTNTLIIGAGAAGLATAACLRKKNVPCLVIDKGAQIGESWIKRYERLHLHTHSFFSSLPYLSFPKGYPRYPSRLQFAEYLKLYAKTFGINPIMNQEVNSVTREQDLWKITTPNTIYLAKHVVVATGYSHTPNRPEWPGQESFPGLISHTVDYTNGARYKGKRVLMVGFGNSAGEIAIDLHEHGAQVSMAVRDAVNIVPRDIFGLSTHIVSVMMSPLPTRLADALSSNLRNVIVGDMTPYGLKKADLGPMTMIAQRSRVPLLDIGTVKLIKSGEIKVYPGLDNFAGRTITFVDGAKAEFDAVVLGTGFTTNLASFLPDADQVSDEKGRVAGGGRESALPGMYFLGLDNAPAGVLRQIRIDSKKIAKAIARKSKSLPKVTPQVAEAV